MILKRVRKKWFKIGQYVGFIEGLTADLAERVTVKISARWDPKQQLEQMQNPDISQGVKLKNYDVAKHFSTSKRLL